MPDDTPPAPPDDPAAALRAAFQGALSGAGLSAYASGAVPTDQDPPYLVVQVPDAEPEETSTTLTWVTTATVRIHTRFPQGQAGYGTMYALRKRARSALAALSRQLPGGYRVLRMRPPTLDEDQTTDDGRTHVDGLLRYELRVQER